MTAAPAKRNKKCFFSVSAYNPTYVAWICALFSVLILCRALHNIFYYVFAAAGLAVFVFSRTRHNFSFLLFLLPFAPLLKLDPDGMSIFAVFFFLTVLKMVFFHNQINAKLLICLLIFFIYCALLSGIGQFTTIATMVAGLLLLYYLRYEDIDATSAVLCFSIGICLSSVLSMFANSLPIVSTFIKESLLKLGEDAYTSRFSGLQGNPNYYTLDIIVALSAIMVQHSSGQSSKLHIPCLLTLSVFGIMSISKSFLLAWALLMLFWLFRTARRNIKGLGNLVLIFVVLAAVSYAFAHEYIDAYLLRFSQDSSGLLNSMTTGRTDLWKAYWTAIMEDTKILFLGNGLNTMLSLGRGTHNTYLECLFSLGLAGSSMLLFALKRSIGKLFTHSLMWIPCLALAVRMFAIGILTYDNLWFYLAVLVVLAKDFANMARLPESEVKK